MTGAIYDAILWIAFIAMIISQIWILTDPRTGRAVHWSVKDISENSHGLTEEISK